MNQELNRSKHKHEYSNAGLYNCPHCQHMFEGEQALQDICANCMGGDKYLEKPLTDFEKLFNRVQRN